MSQSASQAGGGTEQVFRRDGHYWTLAYAGVVVHVRDAKGLHDIARLLARPGAGLHVSELVGASDSRAAESAANDRARAAVAMRIRAAVARIEKEHAALGRHLARSIRTGTTCRYDPEVAAAWVL